MLYTKDKNDAVSSFNLIGAEDNILSTARPGEGDAVDFYTYTKDLRESTINVVGKDGTSQKTYSYTDYGETTEQGENNFYNEICYGGGVYDKTTGLYYLNARYYSPENGSFLTQDTYRGSRSKTETLNLYGYCAGNPISYTDPSGHWIWGVVGAAMGAYDGYKYAKKKGYKGWKMYASIAGGAALGAVNPFKIFKMAKSGYKAYKAVKYTKKARNVYKKTKRVVKVKAKPKATVVAKKQVKSKAKVSKAKKSTRVVKKQTKSVSTRSNRSLATPKTISQVEYRKNIPENTGRVLGKQNSKVETKVYSGHSKPWKVGKPNSIYEQLDDDGNVAKRAFYDQNGNQFIRQDFDHEHFIKSEQAYVQPHEHHYIYNSENQRIGKKVTPLTKGYDNKPTIL